MDTKPNMVRRLLRCDSRRRLKRSLLKECTNGGYAYILTER